MDIKKLVQDHYDEVVRLRRDFHKYPELGFEEHRTSKIVTEYLKDLGLEVETMAKTGVVGLLKGKEDGPTLLLRADMDAIPLQEETDLPFKSVNDGVMHGCGHDGHTSMLMVAAKILTKFKDQIKGNIKFVFQPNEEDAGAWLMMEEGVMENPKVDASLAIHLWSPVKSGEIDISVGSVMAASHYFNLTIKGKGGHAGFPQQSVDPIIAATNIVQAVQSVQTRQTDPLSPSIVMFCYIKGGSSPTIVPEKVELGGSIRFLYEEDEVIKEKFESMISNICKAYNTEYELSFKEGNKIMKNEETMTNLVKEAGAEVLGSNDKVKSEITTMGGEDFSEFAMRSKGALYFVGIGNKEKGTDYPHHHPLFNIDEESLATGIEMHVKTALKYFEQGE